MGNEGLFRLKRYCSCCPKVSPSSYNSTTLWPVPDIFLAQICVDLLQADQVQKGGLDMAHPSAVDSTPPLDPIRPCCFPVPSFPTHFCYELHCSSEPSGDLGLSLSHKCFTGIFLKKIKFARLHIGGTRILPAQALNRIGPLVVQTTRHMVVEMLNIRHSHYVSVWSRYFAASFQNSKLFMINTEH